MVKGWGGIMIGSRIKFQRGPKKKKFISGGMQSSSLSY